jgi:transcriptional regulator with XRE-family HTH domain
MPEPVAASQHQDARFRTFRGPEAYPWVRIRESARLRGVKLAAAQFLRAVRGKRSQVAFARRLGYRANPITDWEHGRRFPTAAEALRAAGRAGIDVASACRRFHSAEPPSADPAELSAWLRALRGSTSLSELSLRCGVSRFALGRWLSGQAQPRLPELFLLIDAITGRLPDLVAELVPIEQVPALVERYRAAAAARHLAFEEPWTEAVLRLLETASYLALPAHQPGVVAGRLGITVEHEERCLQRLEKAGIIRKRAGRYEVQGALTVDTRAAPEAVQRLMAHWSEVALQRFPIGHEADLFAYNVFSISRADLLRVHEMLRATYRELRAIVASSEPTETAALLNLQLVEWGDPARERT